MTKIIITPDLVGDYISMKEKPVMTISKNNIVFGKSAKIKLSLKKDSCFTIQFEDGKLYYSDAPTGFKVNESGKGKIIAAQCSGIGDFIKEKANIKSTSDKLLFEIGEFKEGRRELKLLLK